MSGEERVSGNAAEASDEAPRVCLVTGAARGLGREVAAQLARAGFVVFVGSRSAEAALRTAEELVSEGNVRALPDKLDITDSSCVGNAVRVLEDGYGRLDVLINNAAAYARWGEYPSAADLATSRAVMETNLYGAWRMIESFLPLLLRSPHPRIVNVSSGAGSHGDPRFGLAVRDGAAVSYAVSKAALNALTAALAAELKNSAVVVNAVDPGLTATWPGAEAIGARPVEESAPGVIWAATLPDDGPRGGFFRDGRPHPW